MPEQDVAQLREIVMLIAGESHRQGVLGFGIEAVIDIRAVDADQNGGTRQFERSP